MWKRCASVAHFERVASDPGLEALLIDKASPLGSGPSVRFMLSFGRFKSCTGQRGLARQPLTQPPATRRLPPHN